jgi:hypothetical protein
VKRGGIGGRRDSCVEGYERGGEIDIKKVVKG